MTSTTEAEAAQRAGSKAARPANSTPAAASGGRSLGQPSVVRDAAVAQAEDPLGVAPGNLGVVASRCRWPPVRAAAAAFRLGEPAIQLPAPAPCQLVGELASIAARPDRFYQPVSLSSLRRVQAEFRACTATLLGMNRRAQRSLRLALAVEGSIFPPDQQYRLIEVARLAEAAGVDDLTVPEHVLMGSNASEQDPWSTWERHHLDMPWPEPLLTLAAMASVTSRIRLVSSVVIAPLRPAGLLAKMGATLHALSQGRFVMGVSPSWHRDEYDALGVSFADRGRLMEDAIGACRALWQGAPASFRSATVNFQGMYCQPRPPTGERIAVWFTGKFTPRLVRRVATLGDGWMPFGVYSMTLEQKASAIREIGDRYMAAGRDPATLEICDVLPAMDGSVASSLEQVPAMAAAGINVVRVPLRRFVREPGQVTKTVEQIANRFGEYRRLTPAR